MPPWCDWVNIPWMESKKDGQRDLTRPGLYTMHHAQLVECQQFEKLEETHAHTEYSVHGLLIHEDVAMLRKTMVMAMMWYQ